MEMEFVIHNDVYLKTTSGSATTGFSSGLLGMKDINLPGMWMTDNSVV